MTNSGLEFEIIRTNSVKNSNVALSSISNFDIANDIYQD